MIKQSIQTQGSQPQQTLKQSKTRHIATCTTHRLQEIFVTALRK